MKDLNDCNSLFGILTLEDQLSTSNNEKESIDSYLIEEILNKDSKNNIKRKFLQSYNNQEFKDRKDIGIKENIFSFKIEDYNTVNVNNKLESKYHSNLLGNKKENFQIKTHNITNENESKTEIYDDGFLARIGSEKNLVNINVNSMLDKSFNETTLLLPSFLSFKVCNIFSFSIIKVKNNNLKVDKFEINILNKEIKPSKKFLMKIKQEIQFDIKNCFFKTSSKEVTTSYDIVDYTKTSSNELHFFNDLNYNKDEQIVNLKYDLSKLKYDYLIVLKDNKKIVKCMKKLLEDNKSLFVNNEITTKKYNKVSTKYL